MLQTIPQPYASSEAVREAALGRLRCRAVGALAAAAMSASACVGIALAGDCQLIPNGSFHDGLLGWQVEVVQDDPSGDAAAGASAALFDGSTYGDPPVFDSATLAISASALAGLNGQTGSAGVELVARTSATAAQRYLRVRRGGGFEFQFQGRAAREIRVAFEVATGDGRLAETVLYSNASDGDEACEPGLSVLGTFDALEPRLQVDLAAAGIGVGEAVEVRVRVRVAAKTLADCQFLVNQAFLIVDEFEFCPTRLGLGDLNCDGVIDFFDIEPFLLALFDPPQYTAIYSFCDILRADLTGDGSVDFFDIDPFVECLFGACP